jgi:pyrroline-5-carboxylate reductase
MISIMAGLTTDSIREMAGGEFRLLRLMPNTPALVNAGAFALDSGTDLTDEEKTFAEKLFSEIGIVEWMPEHLIDTACGLSGAGPAYIYLVIEALADGGVDLEMDCTELNYMASSGLRVIQKTMRTVMQQRGQFKMTNVSPEIYKVLNMTGFTKFMKVEQRKD